MASLYIRGMQNFIREYAAFNLWANERICSVTEELTDEQMTQEIPSSFSSIQKTLLHIWDAQLIWINRIEGVSLKEFPSKNFSGTKKGIIDGLLSSSQKLKDLANSNDEEVLTSIKKYATLKGAIVTSALYQVFAHVCNHGTYHRGQLVTMLRQVGVTEIPSTDLIYFYREVK
jgi:uncharacterized damage-inducible protein DinB